MQMADLKLTVEINYGGKFVWNPNLEYIGGNIAYEDVDPDCLSFFLKYKDCVRSMVHPVQVHIIT